MLDGFFKGVWVVDVVKPAELDGVELVFLEQRIPPLEEPRQVAHGFVFVLVLFQEVVHCHVSNLSRLIALFYFIHVDVELLLLNEFSEIIKLFLSAVNWVIAFNELFQIVRNHFGWSFSFGDNDSLD